MSDLLIKNNDNTIADSESIYRYSKEVDGGLKYFIIATFSLLIAILLNLYLSENVTPFGIIGLCVCLCLVFYKARGIKKESLLIIHSLGLQTTTEYSIGRKYTKFIPWCSIHDIIINEAIYGFRVIFYLAVIIKNDSGNIKLQPLFLNSKPRLEELKVIYREVQGILKK